MKHLSRSKKSFNTTSFVYQPSFCFSSVSTLIAPIPTHTIVQPHTIHRTGPALSSRHALSVLETTCNLHLCVPVVVCPIGTCFKSRIAFRLTVRSWDLHFIDVPFQVPLMCVSSPTDTPVRHSWVEIACSSQDGNDRGDTVSDDDEACFYSSLIQEYENATRSLKTLRPPALAHIIVHRHTSIVSTLLSVAVVRFGL